MSGLRAAADRPEHPLREDKLTQALHDAEALGIEIETIPWADVHRAWVLAQASLRYADAIYVAAAERWHTTLLTADARVERSGVPTTCQIITVTPTEHASPGGHQPR
jgi:predicted nucleic acid-binding protein